MNKEIISTENLSKIRKEGIVVATGNPWINYENFKNFLLHGVFLSTTINNFLDFHIEETGKSFYENARLKAHEAFKKNQ